MELDSLRYLPENLRVLRKMFNTVDSYSTYIQLINTCIETDKKNSSQTESGKTAKYDLRSKRYARKVYKQSLEKTAHKKYDYFIEEMKAELGTDSLYELVGCTEAILADKWLTTGQYNLMREDLSHLSWEYDQDMNVDITERNLQKKQKYVLAWAGSDGSENKVPYWSSVIIVTKTMCYVRDSSENDEVINCVTEKVELPDDPEKALYQPFRSIVMAIDKSGELFNLFRIKTQQRPVLLYFNTVGEPAKDSIKEILPSIKSKTKESFAKLISDIFSLQEMWIWNKREGTINNAPSNEQRLRTIKILQSMLPLIDDHGYSKTIEVYENELDQIEHMVNEYVKTCKDTPPLHLPISGFCDFTLFEYPQRLKTAIDYISKIPPALTGLQDYLNAWEKSNSSWLVSTILLYKDRVEELHDKKATEILKNLHDILKEKGFTEGDIKKDPAAKKALEKACIEKMPTSQAFYELADHCFYDQPICVSGEIIYKDI